MTVTETPTAVSKLPLLIMGVVVGLAVLVTVALVAFRGNTNFEPGTPEAALQDFLEAGFDGESDVMIGLLTEPAQTKCRTDLERDRFDSFSSEMRAELEDMSVTGTTASARVEFHHGGNSDPFDNSRWSFDEHFELEQVDGEWLVATAGWPWQFAECTGGRR